jgi:hypothetical protein
MQDESMSADHPTSVVSNLQFLSQASTPASAAASGTASRRRAATASNAASPQLRGVPSDTISSTDTPAEGDEAPAAVTTGEEEVADTEALNAASDAAANAKADQEHAIRVLLYSGEFDLNCNTLGTLHTLEANKWRNK